MKKKTFVTASHTTYDETETVNLLEKSDVDKIVSGLESDLKTAFERQLKTFATSTKRETESIRKEIESVHDEVEESMKVAKNASERIDSIQKAAPDMLRSVLDETLKPFFAGIGEMLCRINKVEQSISSLDSHH